jgi:hypothetical protein
MRSPNILLGPGGDVKFIDFDWAGKIGEARYPSSMNPNVNWHEDVSLAGLIAVEHDCHLLNSEFDPYIKPPLKKQRLCSWYSKY